MKLSLCCAQAIDGVGLNRLPRESLDISTEPGRVAGIEWDPDASRLISINRVEHRANEVWPRSIAMFAGAEHLAELSMVSTGAVLTAAVVDPITVIAGHSPRAPAIAAHHGIRHHWCEILDSMW